MVLKNLALTRCGMIAHTYDPSTQETKDEGLLWIWNQSRIQSEFKAHYNTKAQTQKQKTDKISKQQQIKNPASILAFVVIWESGKVTWPHSQAEASCLKMGKLDKITFL